jgi:hypothetical protein
MHRQIPLACLGRSCIATVNAPAYEESAHLQYFPHLGQSLPRFDRPESLLHGPEIPPWASLPLVESAAHLLWPLNPGEDLKDSVTDLCQVPCVLGLDSMCLLSPLPCLDSPTLKFPQNIFAQHSLDHLLAGLSARQPVEHQPLIRRVCLELERTCRLGHTEPHISSGGLLPRGNRVQRFKKGGGNECVFIPATPDAAGVVGQLLEGP